MKEDIAISVSGVYKNFKLPHEQHNSIKSIFTNIHKKKVKGFEVQHALKDISFEVKKGEFFGIVGRNGSGKSTLLKLIADIYQPTKGHIRKSGKLVPFIELGVGFNPELTGRENVYLNGALLGFTTKEIDKMYDNIVAFAELEKFMDQKLKNYSSGMQVRLAFSMATRSQADVLVIDEVLAVGDADFQRKCFEYFRKLKRDKKTVVFVSHDMNAIRDYCDRAVLIENSELVVSGNAQKVATAYSKLFAPVGESSTTDEDSTMRYGSKRVVIDKVSVAPVDKKDQKVVVKVDLTSHIDTTNPRIGFTLKDSTLRPLNGTNTKIEDYDLGELKKGQSYSLSFEMDNIYNKGDYTVDASIEDHEAEEIFDWWEEAARFWIESDKPTAFVVSPPVKVIKNPKNANA